MQTLEKYSVEDYHSLGLKTKINTVSKKSRRAMANDFSALNPTIWANEAIVQLLPNMVIANLISRDFDQAQIARFGDVVNAYIPGTFQMARKGSLCENVVVQDASGSTLQVPLDQWPQVSFLICDGEENRPALDLVDTLLTPAMLALAQGVDRILGSQVYHFLGNVSGHAGGMDESTVKDYLLEARENMNRRNVPLAGRTMLLTPGTETAALGVENFTIASAVGDNGQALAQALLGRKYGWDLFMTQTQPEITTGQVTVGTITINAGNLTAGSTVLTVSGAGGNSTLPGQWAIVAGDDTPQQITARTNTSLTITPGLKRNIANSAAVTVIASGAVNNGGGYVGTTTNPRVIGYAKEIAIDGLANSSPELGQMVTFGIDTNRYAIIKLTTINLGAGTFGITLDRPLVNAIADNALVNLGPAAKYNFGFIRNAFTFVSRPLPQPRAGTGAISRVVVDPINKISIRVTITYDGQKQGHLVTLDLLMGVGVLSNSMGEVMLG